MNCSRSQVLQVLYAAMGKPAYTIDNPYTDVADDAWFKDAAIWAYENGLEKGEDGTFNPNAECNRVTIVLYLYRFFTGEGLVE